MLKKLKRLFKKNKCIFCGGELIQYEEDLIYKQPTKGRGLHCYSIYLEGEIYRNINRTYNKTNPTPGIDCLIVKKTLICDECGFIHSFAG